MDERIELRPTQGKFEAEESVDPKGVFGPISPQYPKWPVRVLVSLQLLKPKIIKNSKEYLKNST